MWHTYDKIHVREKTGTTLLVAGIATNIEQLARIDSIYNKHWSKESELHHALISIILLCLLSERMFMACSMFSNVHVTRV